MKKTIALDCHTFPYPAEVLFATVLDLDSYRKWWPSFIYFCVLNKETGYVGSRFRVNVLGGGFTGEIVSIAENREIMLRYFDGVHKGSAKWTLTPMQQGTSLCYHVDLEPQGILPRLLSHVLDFSAFHSKMMKKLFQGLEQYLTATARKT